MGSEFVSNTYNENISQPLDVVLLGGKCFSSCNAVNEHTSLTEWSSKTSSACASELVDPVHASCVILAGIAFTLIDIC